MAPHSPPVIIQEPHPTDPLPRSQKEKEKELRKKKFVPWEPYKAAPSADRKGEKPGEITKELIPYRVSGEDLSATPYTNLNTKQYVDERRIRLERERVEESERIRQLEERLAAAEAKVCVEQELNAELKRLLVATIDDDLQCHVNALTEDKVRLADTLNRYAERLQSEDEHVEALRIERDVLKCKFLAMSIRADELKGRSEALLRLLRCGQGTLSDLVPLLPALPDPLRHRVASFLQLDVCNLVERSPCDEKYSRPEVNYHNLTIACCKNCAGKEIQLL